tara:strand:+ start:606 stop:1043 length:438 start_codon:yes stop_codon:yes gene_type:complete
MKSYKIFVIFFQLYFFFIPLTLASQDRLDNINSEVFENIISKQISAIQSGNKKIAFSYASKNIKKKFINEENFYQMVKNNYPQIYYSEKFKLGKILIRKVNSIQEVKLFRNKLHTATAYYIFIKNDLDEWKIDGVVIKSDMSEEI